ncbi:ABC transporter ATP-binding protein [Actinomadura mexicana]|nr:ABC transporter ATP-binding protein [Actinomadura mexicana]
MLRTTGVCKTFGGVRALNEVDVTARAGRITALIGPNGAGKTTLFNTLTGFESIDRGHIFLEDRKIDGLPPWRIARLGLGRSFQTPTGFPSLTVRENLMVAAARTHQERLSWCFRPGRHVNRGEAAARDKVDHSLERLGIEHLANSRVADISIGDAKLVEIARQLVREPRILLLDEPAAGVDPSQVGTLIARLHDLHDQGMTMLLIDHNLSFVFGVADDVHVLALGKVIASGSPGEVMGDQRVRDVYLGESHDAA